MTTTLSHSLAWCCVRNRGLGANQGYQSAEKVVIYRSVLRVAAIYREVYGWVDRSNQQLLYYSIKVRSIRKQGRVFDCLAEMYVLVNDHAIWCNSPNLVDKQSQSESRFSIICVWYAMFKRTNGKMEILHYPSNKQKHHRRKLAPTVTSPRKEAMKWKELHQRRHRAMNND